MSSDDEKTASLVRSPSHALARPGSTSLVQRGMQDLLAAEDAENWLKKGLELSAQRRYEEAALWYRKAAEQGLASAQVRLGWAYECGCGVPKDDSQAALWYRKGADQGDANLQLALAMMYLEGKGVPHDSEQAVFWLRKSADQGEVGAQSELARIYEAGEIVPQNYAEAAYWYLKVAVLDEECLHDAQRRLGHMYENGLGVPKDSKQAAEWYRKAEQGEKLSKVTLAEGLSETEKRYSKLSAEQQGQVLDDLQEYMRILSQRQKPGSEKPQ
jgi:TPR repeat protein